MSATDAVIDEIRQAFAAVEYPGDAFLQGSYEGCEPYEEVAPFKGRHAWSEVDAELLDRHYVALSFFSEAGFRFFLPAYLVADVQGKLQTAEPLFHLTGGFHDGSAQVSTRTRVFVREFGGTVLLNPRRYGAITFNDYARYRLSVFTREEAKAIVAYLLHKRDADVHGVDKGAIDAALRSFWLARAEHAPSAEQLGRHLAQEREYLAAIQRDADDKT